MQSKFYKLKDALDQVDSLQQWSKGSFTCYACRKSVKGDKFTSRVGSLCRSCVEAELKKNARSVKLAEWSIPQIMETLAAGDNVQIRLTVLWRFHEVFQRVTKEAPDQVEQLKKLLIRNMGYVQDHPLAQPVRQAAFQACVDLGKSLTPLLLSMCATTPWQFYANVVMTLGKINPHDPQVYAVLERAAQDPHAEVRKRAQAVLLEIAPEKFTAKVAAPEQTEQQERLKAVVNTLSPDLRSLVNIGLDAKASVDTPDAKASVGTPDEKTSTRVSAAEQKRIEVLVNQFYTADALKQLYRSYVQDVDFHDAHSRVNTRISVNKLKKAQITDIMAAVFANASLFQAFFKSLPQAAQSIFQELIWHKEEREVEFLEKEYNVHIVKNGQYGRGNVQDLEDAYALFRVRSQYDWRSHNRGSRYKYYLSIPDELRPVFKPYLPLPDGYELHALKTITPTEFVYENQDRILHNIKLYASYIEQGNLKYSKSTGKLLKSSLTQMAKYCNIEEFYDNTRKDLQYLKTPLIIDFLQGMQIDATPVARTRSKAAFYGFFSGYTTPGQKAL